MTVKCSAAARWPRSCSTARSAMNAWDKQLGVDLLARGRGRRASDDAVRAVVITGAGARSRSGADLRAGFDPTPEGHPDVQKALHERYHPIIIGIRDDAQAGDRRRQRRRGGHRLLARARLRPDRRRRVGLLPAGLREHRPGARRRLVAVRSRARRASPARPRWRCSASASRRRAGARVGPDQPRGRRRRARCARPTRSPTASPRARRASYAGTKRQLNAWRSPRMEAAAGARGLDPAGAGRLARLRRGRQAFVEKREPRASRALTRDRRARRRRPRPYTAGASCLKVVLAAACCSRCPALAGGPARRPGRSRRPVLP